MNGPATGSPAAGEPGTPVLGHAEALWRDAEFARGWAAGDDLEGMLAVPRTIAATLVGTEIEAPDLVIDVASGPGEFLAVFLDRFPAARGVWTDVSAPMLDLARQRLAGYGDRVEYRLADMTDLTAADLPRGASAVITSRASHHLDSDRLRAFYRQAAALLVPGGWLVNLDHIRHPQPWDARLRAARNRLRPRPDRELSPNRYGHPLPTMDDHLTALGEAGLDDVGIAWQAFVTHLIVARRG